MAVEQWGCRMTLDEIKQRILARCEWREGPLETPCLVWTGARDSGGYGRLRFNNNRHFVHRLLYSIEKGEIPEGLQICHHCDNRPCCNVDHLFRGTSGDNQIDACRKGRHPSATLTEAEVSLIKYFLKNGWTCAELGRRYGVDRRTISKIKTGECWRHTRPFQPIEGEPLPVPRQCW
jgi:HNH endonuclease